LDHAVGVHKDRRFVVALGGATGDRGPDRFICESGADARRRQQSLRPRRGNAQRRCTNRKSSNDALKVTHGIPPLTVALETIVIWAKLLTCAASIFRKCNLL